MTTHACTTPPAGLAEMAADAIRSLNHTTRPAVTTLDPAEIYTLLAALADIAAGLPQTLTQLQMHLRAERTTVTAGVFAGDAPAAIARARAHLTRASAAAAPLADAIDAAQQVLAELASHDGCETSEMTDQGVNFQPRGFQPSSQRVLLGGR